MVAKRKSKVQKTKSPKRKSKVQKTKSPKRWITVVFPDGGVDMLVWPYSETDLVADFSKRMSRHFKQIPNDPLRGKDPTRWSWLYNNKILDRSSKLIDVLNPEVNPEIDCFITPLDEDEAASFRKDCIRDSLVTIAFPDKEIVIALSLTDTFNEICCDPDFENSGGRYMFGGKRLNEDETFLANGIASGDRIEAKISRAGLAKMNKLVAEKKAFEDAPNQLMVGVKTFIGYTPVTNKLGYYVDEECPEGGYWIDEMMREQVEKHGLKYDPALPPGIFRSDRGDIIIDDNIIRFDKVAHAFKNAKDEIVNVSPFRLVVNKTHTFF